jgi:hypothetical protein
MRRFKINGIIMNNIIGVLLVTLLLSGCGPEYLSSNVKENTTVILKSDAKANTSLFDTVFVKKGSSASLQETYGVNGEGPWNTVCFAKVAGEYSACLIDKDNDNYFDVAAYRTGSPRNEFFNLEEKSQYITKTDKDYFVKKARDSISFSCDSYNNSAKYTGGKENNKLLRTFWEKGGVINQVYYIHKSENDAGQISYAYDSSGKKFVVDLVTSSVDTSSSCKTLQEERSDKIRNLKLGFGTLSNDLYILDYTKWCNESPLEYTRHYTINLSWDDLYRYNQDGMSIKLYAKADNEIIGLSKDYLSGYLDRVSKKSIANDIKECGIE